MKRNFSDEELNKRLQSDLNHYILLCVFGEASAFALMKIGAPLIAAYCAFIPACMIIIYLFLSPPCNRKDGKVLSGFMLLAVSTVILGIAICLHGGTQPLRGALTWKQFGAYCAASALIFFIGIRTGFFPLPPKKEK